MLISKRVSLECHLEKWGSLLHLSLSPSISTGDFSKVHLAPGAAGLRSPGASGAANNRLPGVKRTISASGGTE